MAPGLQQIGSLENVITSRTMLAMKFNEASEEFDNPEEVARECIFGYPERGRSSLTGFIIAFGSLLIRLQRSSRNAPRVREGDPRSRRRYTP